MRGREEAQSRKRGRPMGATAQAVGAKEVSPSDPRDTLCTRWRGGHTRAMWCEDPARDDEDQDITGSARVVEMFEARTSRVETAILARQTRQVKYAKSRRDTQDLRRGRGRREALIRFAARRPYQCPGGETVQGRRADHGWSPHPARHSGCAGEDGTAEVPGPRDFRKVYRFAGREYQRQAP